MKPTISVIVCTHRSVRSIGLVISSILFHHPHEIIVVDACSADGTAKIAKSMGAKVLFDNGSGLGNARNTGLEHATGNYVLYVGPDNLLPKTPNLFNKLINAMIHFKFDGLGIRSKVYSPISYFDNGMDLRWKNKITAGRKSVIGTPFMFKRSILNKYRFNTEMSMSDDTELCERMAKSGRVVGYSNLECFEISYNNLQELYRRFKAYGKSDGEYYLKENKSWKLGRKLQSLAHPLSEYVIIKGIKDLKFIPFVTLIVMFRYIGYIKRLIGKGA